ncbi:MAG: hypothetical protein V2B15_19375 [Bacteroidota bacterium]
MDIRIEELARQKLEGKSYSEIRADLLASGLSGTEVSSLIRQVDNKVLQSAVEGNRADRASKLYRVGLVVAIGGLVLSIMFNLGLIAVNLPAMAVYAPFIAGILLMFYGRMQQRKQPQAQAKGPGPIRSRRPFK